MFRKFQIDPSRWAYADLAKMAKSFGGPQDLLNTVRNSGRVEGIVSTIVVGLLKEVVVWGVKQLPSMINGKHDLNDSTNSYVECSKCGTRLENRSGPSDDTGYLECPNCTRLVGSQPPDYQI